MLHYRIYLKNYWEAQEDEFSFVNYREHFSEDEPCNIYLVGIRPRVVIDPMYYELLEGAIKLKFRIQNKYSFTETFGTLPLNREVMGNLIIESEEPFSRFLIKDDIGYFAEDKFKELLKKNKAHGKSFYTLRDSMHDCDFKFNDLELVYIGKSHKMDKKISPVKRLSSHSKMQRILYSCTQKHFDKEVYIILCSFVKKIDLIAFPQSFKAYTTEDEMKSDLRNKLEILNANNLLTTQIAEASLIDYFDTKEYNKDFIGSFGSKKHTYYSNIINSEISTLSIELDLQDLCRVYSKSVEPMAYHKMAYFPKHNFKRDEEGVDESIYW
ncbi:MAG: hypothetical protein DI539_21495 [Flavobacterium psychrophilum]|nr:MAG: hypothetical protein DI539_21495 [Flavobacterium psychrophilum]